MPKTKISEYSSTANSNTDIASINIDEGCAPSGINNAIRALMAQIHDLYAGTTGDTWPVAGGGTGSGTASGARTNLGLVIGTDVQAYDADLAAIASSGKGAEIASYGTYGVGFKNRIINGAMMIDQRNAGASITPTNTQYSVDRWRGQLSQASKYSMQQNAGSVTPPTGFTNYLGITSLSAYSVGASDFFDIRQVVEGFNTADLGWGTASAQAVTLSFWVRSSLTGTFGGALKNEGGNRSYPFTYAISAANTWEYKTVTIPGDTSGTWATTNGSGMNVQLGLGVGSTYSGTAGSWQASNFISATGATSVVGTSGATWYITGVQLEKGSTATSFDYRPYGTELQLCQRYFNMIVKGSGQVFATGTCYSTTRGDGVLIVGVPMRTTPALELTTGANYYRIYAGSATANVSSISFNEASYSNDRVLFYNNTEVTGVTAGFGGWWESMNASAQIALKAEL